MIKIYRQLPIDKKRKLKSDLLKLRDNYKKQNEKLTLLFLKPNLDSIKLIDRVLKNEVDLEQYLYTSNKIQEYKAKVFKMFKIVKKIHNK
jgi:hypothetical protein